MYNCSKSTFEVSFMSAAVTNGEGFVHHSYMAKTKGDVSCAQLYKYIVLLMKVAILVALVEDRS